MDYILFETQSNLAELISFAICGVVCGSLYALVKGDNSILKSSLTFLTLATCVVLCMLNIEKSHTGYQTFLVPLATFFLIYKALK